MLVHRQEWNAKRRVKMSNAVNTLSANQTGMKLIVYAKTVGLSILAIYPPDVSILMNATQLMEWMGDAVLEPFARIYPVVTAVNVQVDLPEILSKNVPISMSVPDQMLADWVQNVLTYLDLTNANVQKELWLILILKQDVMK